MSNNNNNNIYGFSPGTEYEETCDQKIAELKQTQLKDKIQAVKDGVKRLTNMKNKPSKNMLAQEIGKLNSQVQPLINEANANLCYPGSACDIKKNKNKLKEEYEEARDLAYNLPSRLNKAKEAYYIAIQGKQKWNDIQYKEFNKTASNEQDILINIHDKSINQLIANLESYSLAYFYEEELDYYRQSLKEENKILVEKLNSKDDIRAISQRITWYDNNEIDSLSPISKTLIAIYLCCVAIYIYYFIKKKLWNKFSYRNYKVDVGLLIFFLAWPIFNIKIMEYIFKFVHYVLSFIPKDVYASLVNN